jgi:hypothetical protein
MLKLISSFWTIYLWTIASPCKPDNILVICRNLASWGFAEYQPEGFQSLAAFSKECTKHLASLASGRTPSIIHTFEYERGGERLNN